MGEGHYASMVATPRRASVIRHTEEFRQHMPGISDVSAISYDDTSDISLGPVTQRVGNAENGMVIRINDDSDDDVLYIDVDEETTASSDVSDKPYYDDVTEDDQNEPPPLKYVPPCSDVRESVHAHSDVVREIFQLTHAYYKNENKNPDMGRASPESLYHERDLLKHTLFKFIRNSYAGMGGRPRVYRKEGTVGMPPSPPPAPKTLAMPQRNPLRMVARVDSSPLGCAPPSPPNPSSRPRPPALLKPHVVRHPNDKHLLCEYCHKKFSNADAANRHLLTHKGKRTLKCTHCSRSFYEQSAYLRHLKSHNGEKAHKCEQCSMAFSKRSALEVHIRTHTGERPFVCKYCSKGFSISGNLHRHVLIHTGHRPYKCGKCPRAFNNPSHLARHISSFHA